MKNLDSATLSPWGGCMNTSNPLSPYSHMEVISQVSKLTLDKPLQGEVSDR